MDNKCLLLQKCQALGEVRTNNFLDSICCLTVQKYPIIPKSIINSKKTSKNTFKIYLVHSMEAFHFWKIHISFINAFQINNQINLSVLLETLKAPQLLEKSVIAVNFFLDLEYWIFVGIDLLETMCIIMCILKLNLKMFKNPRGGGL